MIELLSFAVGLALFVASPVLLLLAIRHFVPLMRGLQAPPSAYVLGPLLLASDQYFTAPARPHHKKALAYGAAFLVASGALVQVAIA